MTETMVFELGRNTLIITLMLSLPILLVSLVVGVVVGIFQAATQIHEATLAFVPKILALFAVMAVLGPWMLQNLLQFMSKLLMYLPNLTK